MLVFFGGLVLSGAAVLLHLGDEFSSGLPWLVASVALYAVVVGRTVAVNVPLNDYIKAAGDPDQIDVADVRSTFNAKRWVRTRAGLHAGVPGAGLQTHDEVVGGPWS